VIIDIVAIVFGESQKKNSNNINQLSLCEFFGG
jgi:hypothetical protein